MAKIGSREKKIRQTGWTILLFFISLSQKKFVNSCSQQTMIKRKDGFSGERSVVLPPMVVDMEREDALTSSLFVTDIGYYPHAAHHCRERREGLSEHVLIYCVEGRGWYRLSNNVMEVRAGEFFILPAGRPHAYGSAEGEAWTIYWVHFGGTHSNIYVDGAQEPQRINTAINSRIIDRNNIFEEILTTLSHGCGLEHLRYASALLHHYLASMRYLDMFRAATQKDSASAQSQYIDPVGAAIHYMQEHVEQRITLNDVLHYVGYSSSRFSKLFRQRTGCSPLAYFNLLKVQAARRWLDETDLCLNQICHKVGIEDPYYFSRLFSKTMGLSPQAYRRRQKG